MSELKKNPKWTIDETILCLDFYFKYRPSIPGKTSKELSKLHALIQKFNDINNVSGTETFRNHDGIYMKLMNLMHLDPSAKSGLPRNSKVDHEVWEKYSGDIKALSKLSSKIQNLIENEGQELKKSIISDDELESYEGRVIFKKHKVYERDQKLVKQKKTNMLKKNGRLFCEACGFDFYERYGDRGDGYIECHHNVAVSELPEGYKTKQDDLTLLCSNCHKMIHRKRPWISVDELLNLMKI